MHRKQVMKEVLFLLIITLSLNSSQQLEEDQKTFPKGFQFGVATSAYQIEGAWDEGGKGENIWDHMVHNQPNKIKDRSTGDIACDSYHKFKEDIALVKKMGLDYYRFSLSWSRIFPTGQTNKINVDGVRYYEELIDELLANGIQPMVTLYHWDLPQPLQDLGGLTNRFIVQYFVDYARFAFDTFGDKVKLWLTFNEPKNSCQLGYGWALIPPMISSSGVGDYICSAIVLLAHAATYRLYNNTFRTTQNGRISIALDSAWFEPSSNSTEDLEAAERIMQFKLGGWANPIFHKEGDYPKIMKEFIAQRSEKERYPRTRLPKLSKGAIKYIRGTYDFFGLNYYTAFLATDREEQPIGETSQRNDLRVKLSIDPSWPSSATMWLKVVPWGLRKVLNWIKDKYDNPEIIITANGFSDYGELDDCNRIRYHELHLENLLEAIHNDNVNVTMYTAWSLLDNFQWISGYTEKFGFYQVNFTDPDRTRTPKASSKYYKKIVAQRRLVSSNCEN